MKPTENFEILFEKQVRDLENEIIPCKSIVSSLYTTQELILKKLEEQDIRDLAFSDLVQAIMNTYAVTIVDGMWNYTQIQRKLKK